MTLPRLEVAELDSPFDEALILVDGHEEETIRLECAGARALRSYEFGNGSPEFARAIADHCEALTKQTGEAA